VNAVRTQRSSSRPKRDDVVAWLRDAHSMETSHIGNLHQLVGFSNQHPVLKSHFEHHIAVSMCQRDEIGQELERLGAYRSVVKDWGMMVTAQLQPFLCNFTRDAMLKNCLLAHAYEAFEIASYRSLLGAAEELGMTDLLAMCGRYVGEEQEMADFLFYHLPDITSEYLSRRR